MFQEDSGMDQSDFSRRILAAHLPRYEEFPAIELYLDQILKLVNDACEPFLFGAAEKPLTGTMVNNYVKHGVLPSPRKKLYHREHLTKLIFITIMKSVFSMPEIKKIFELLADRDPVRIYNRFCAELETLSECIFLSKLTPMPEDPDSVFLRVMVSAAVSKLYVQVSLPETREKADKNEKQKNA